MLHLALDDPSGQGVEGDLGLVTGAYALQRVLLEAGSKLLIVGVDEHHDGTEWSGNDIHAWTQRHLRHITWTWRPHDSLVEIVFGVAQLGLQAGDRGVHAADFRFIGELGSFCGGLSLGQGLFCSIDIAGRDIECRLGDNLLLEEL